MVIWGIHLTLTRNVILELLHVPLKTTTFKILYDVHQSKTISLWNNIMNEHKSQFKDFFQEIFHDKKE